MAYGDHIFRSCKICKRTYIIPQNMLHIWWETLDLLAATFLCADNFRWTKVNKMRHFTDIFFCLFSGQGGGALPHLKLVRNFLYWLYAQLHIIDLLFLQKKIILSLSHLVPEIIWPKVGLFSKNLSFNTFGAICNNFLLDFWSQVCHSWPTIQAYQGTCDPISMLWVTPVQK